MNEKYLLDTIKQETLVKLIDETLTIEKTAKNKTVKTNLFKIISVAAALVLFIGFLNIVPFLMKFEADNIELADHANEITNSENVYTPAVDQRNLFLPDAIEKSFFENKIIAAVTDKSDLDKILAYYRLTDSDSIYRLAPTTTKREKDKILNYLYEYTDLTRSDMMQMCIDNNLPLPKNVDPAYSHVRFGDDYNTLLLEIEWHTYDTYMKEVAEPFKQRFIEFRESEDYINLSEEDKNERENNWEHIINFYEENAELIKDNISYSTRKINGKICEEINYSFGFGNEDYPVNNISQYLDSDGYYIYEIFPLWVGGIEYLDENGELQTKQFYSGRDACGNGLPCYTQEEYDSLLIDKKIPFCDDLLARGLINQEAYDYYTIKTNWLDYYIELFFK
ncbi:MAG: hypothetical protein FWF92_08000 [Oscillospiraceae bacterium]|nr:hypothetical protein [Oscillospiraceae bacterium]